MMIAEYNDNKNSYYGYFNFIHGENDSKSFIGFLHKKPIAGIEHSVLSKTFMINKIQKKFRDGYIDDLYMSVNTFYRQERTVSNLRWINAIYIDLDCYKNNLEKESALYFLEHDHFGKDIPRPSMIVDSGRGLYLIFRIKAVPSQARPLWDAIQRNFQSKLDYLGADIGAIDAARVLRIPGTINSKTNTEVKVLECNENVYDIHDLKENYLPDIKYQQKKKIRKKNRRKISYFFTTHSLQVSRALDIEKLVDLRKGDMVGYRERTLFLYRYFLSLSSNDAESVTSKILDLNGRFIEPLNEKEALSATNNCIEKAAINKYKYRNSTIVNLLDITEEEQQHLKTLIVSKEKNERRKEVRKKERRDDGNLTDRERKKLEKLMKVRLLLERGLTKKEIATEMSCSKSQIYRDIKDLESETIKEKLKNISMTSLKNIENTEGLVVSHEMSSYIDALASVSSLPEQEEFLLLFDSC